MAISESTSSDWDIETKPKKPLKGVGIGLRLPHIHQIIQQKPDVDWLEIHSCNFLNSPTNLALLDHLAEHYPLSFHGVSMNLGGLNPLDQTYLAQLKKLTDRYQPNLISDHVCFTANDDQHFHDLLPIPYTEEAVDHLSERIQQIQETLGREILIENISRYFSYPKSHSDTNLSEGQFLSAIASQTNCGLLLDINNAYVNQINHPNDSTQKVLHFIKELPRNRIKEIHLGGHHQESGKLIDSHSSEVSLEVWQLFDIFCRDAAVLDNADHHPPVLIEWDNDLPPLETLLQQCLQAKARIDSGARNKDFSKQYSAAMA